MKETTPFFELPVLEVPEVGTIGHELAILNYIGRKVPEMAGATDKDFAVSQQLLNQGEDIYQKMSKIKSGLIAGEAADGFWSDENAQTHNRNYGIKVFLRLLEAFQARCAAGAGRFTSSGNSVGECKLFASLHACKMIREDVLEGYPGVRTFYARFAA